MNNPFKFKQPKLLGFKNGLNKVKFTDFEDKG
jgi:hypothetical protein